MKKPTTSTPSSISAIPSRVSRTAFLLLSALILCLIAAPGARAANITVNTLADELDTPAGPDISLREAIRDLPAGETILFNASLNGKTITLTNGQLTIDKDLTIDASALTQGITIDANGDVTNHRVMEITPGNTVALDSLTLTGGRATVSYPANTGGAIYSDDATLSLSACTLSGNSAGFGGGICSDGSEGSATLSLSACTLSGNSARFGGGIYSNGSYNGSATLSLSACTLSGNSAAQGGGIYSNGRYSGNATLILNACTLSANSAASGGGIYSSVYSGSATPGIATVSLRNSILAGNTAYVVPDLKSGVTTATGQNLLSSIAGSDITLPNPAITIVASPLLAPLGGYGGPTRTMHPLPGSPAIDPAGGATTATGTDQRGFPRLNGTSVDIGAVEADGFSLDLRDGGSQLHTLTPGSVTQGGNVTVMAGILNLGSLESGSFEVKVYLSTDPTIDQTDTLLATVTMDSIQGGSFGDLNFNNATVPLSLPPGDYYVGWIIDPGNAVTESDETDNTVLFDSGNTKLTVKATPPSPPTNVMASDGTYTDKVFLSWTPSTDGTHYRVYRRATDNSDAFQAVSSWRTNTTFADSSGVPGKVYKYWVQAANAGAGAGPYSQLDTGYRNLPPSNAPTNLMASDGTYTDRVWLTWSASSDATHYKVYRRDVYNSDEFQAVSSWRTATSFSDFNAEPGKSYKYWVRAAKSGSGLGLRPYSALDTGYQDLPPSSAPTNVTATDGSYSDRVWVVWSPPSGATHYRVYRRAANNSDELQPLSWWREGTSFPDFTAEPGKSYKYWVVAAKTASGLGASGYSALDRGYRGIASSSAEALASVNVEDPESSDAGDAVADPAESGYDAWASGFDGIPVDKAGRLDDADGDGTTNVMELFHGTSPVDPAERGGITVLPRTGDEPVKISLKIGKDTPPEAGEILWSADRVNWQPAGELTNGVNVTLTERTVDASHPNHDVVEITATVTYGSPENLYLKLEVDTDGL